MKRATLLLQKFPQYATDFVFFAEKRCSRSLYLTIGRRKSVADCRNFWRRSLAFSWVRALRGLPLPGRLLTVPVSRNFLNSLLTPRFVQLFSGISSVNLFAVYPFKYKLFIKNCPRRLISCWLLTNTAVTCLRWRISDATNWSPKSISKGRVTWKIVYAISMEKDSLF